MIFLLPKLKSSLILHIIKLSTKQRIYCITTIMKHYKVINSTVSLQGRAIKLILFQSVVIGGVNPGSHFSNARSWSYCKTEDAFTMTEKYETINDFSGQSKAPAKGLRNYSLSLCGV